MSDKAISWPQADQTNLISIVVWTSGPGQSRQPDGTPDKTDTTATLNRADGTKLHWEVIAYYVDGAREWQSSVGSGDIIFGVPASPAGLTANLELIPAVVTISGLVDNDPAVTGAAAFNGDHVIPSLRNGIYFLGDIKWDTVDTKPFYLVVSNTDRYAVGIVMLWSDTGGISGSPAFIGVGSCEIDPNTGQSNQISNDDSSGYASGGTAQVTV